MFYGVHPSGPAKLLATRNWTIGCLALAVDWTERVPLDQLLREAVSRVGLCIKRRERRTGKEEGRCRKVGDRRLRCGEEKRCSPDSFAKTGQFCFEITSCSGGLYILSFSSC